MFGLRDLSAWIDSAISAPDSTTSAGLAGNLYRTAFAAWFSTYGFRILIGIAVFVVILFIFYGAFLYFTAFGDENRAAQAKKTLTFAFVGLVIVLSSFAIASFVQRLLIAAPPQGVNTTTNPNAGTTDPRELTPVPGIN